LLDLNVKSDSVHFDAVVVPNVLCQVLLVVVLDLAPGVAKLGIVSKCFQLLEVIELFNPVVADLLGD